ncbi:N-acetyl-gamma-glutamyl-phosphate reductase [Olavius algarvensis spirochete endosymbiont]|uniref:N-acetyl-gamma-glutamyl-phosphate reductase n=1 Tax=Olavius algarvensis spirochete endosymbiont TaxID=260710 RepID=UPI000F1378CD|nr:N-acetyl-gamma-glutamyl-phosphate reductase [Olavius algarvensis spirochete endosymbiont]VDA99607.1 N-acetyl-gamma-glutamyl-phosphate reductase [Olavius algarvensis spirochete endosymbiont]
MRICVLGASGYTGAVLMRLLMDHPKVTELIPVSSTAVGRPIDEVDWGLGADTQGKLPSERSLLSRDQALRAKPDAVFSALPHGVSAQFCKPFFSNSIVLDLSADFRLKNEEAHRRAYGTAPPMRKLRETAVYGLTELRENDIREANLISVPGCYPTCALLPILPLAHASVIASATITINSLSGISGAGRSEKKDSMFVERSENALAYNPGISHRHHPEMVQEIRRAGISCNLFFIPHLVPMRRGIFSTISVPVNGEHREIAMRVEEALGRAYADKLFINLTGNRIPSTRDVVGSNRCDIGWTVESTGNGVSMLFLFSVIDNLLKGASGQAIQDFNIRFGFPQDCGLPLRGEV